MDKLIKNDYWDKFFFLQKENMLCTIAKRFFYYPSITPTQRRQNNEMKRDFFYFLFFSIFFYILFYFLLFHIPPFHDKNLLIRLSLGDSCIQIQFTENLLDFLFSFAHQRNVYKRRVFFVKLCCFPSTFHQDMVAPQK